MANESLRVVVRNNPFEEPLLDTQQATTIEIRDSAGNLLALMMVLPNHPVFIVSKADHEDFEQFVKGTGIKLIDKNHGKEKTP